MVANKPKVPSYCTFRYFFFLCFWLLTLLKTCSIKHASFSDQFSSVAQSCPTLRDPMDCSTPGLPVHHQLRSSLKLMFIKSVMPSNHLISVIPFSSRLQSLPASGSFPRSQLFALGSQSIGASASSSVLLMNIQDWFPLGLTGLTSFQSMRLSREPSPTPQFKSIISLEFNFLYGPTLTSIHDCWKIHGFD